jgi:hypothetical protein
LYCTATGQWEQALQAFNEVVPPTENLIELNTATQFAFDYHHWIRGRIPAQLWNSSGTL